MACSITITSVLGTPVSSTITSVVVTGTASGCAAIAPNPNPEVIVSIGCGGQVPSQGTATVDQFGNWTITLQTKCLCGQPVTITATCASDATCTTQFIGPLPCDCCPKISQLTVQVGNCDISGNRPVILSAIVDVLQQGCTPVLVQWNFGDGNFSSVTTYNASGSYTFTGNHAYSPGTYFATLIIITPTGCQPQTIQVIVPPCPTSCCPLLSPTVVISDCDANGNFTATFTTTVTVNQGCPSAVIEWNFGDGSFGGAQAFGPGTSTFTTPPHTYNINGNPAPPFTATLNVISPSGCPGASLTINPPSTDACDCSKKPKKKFCNLLSQIFTYAFGFILVIGIILSCLASFTVPPTQVINALTAIIVILAIIGAIALVLYLIFCNKCVPCGWFWLFLWRIFFGAGIILLIFSANTSPCNTCNTCLIYNFCNYFNTLGWIFTGLGLLFLALWVILCNISLCDLLQEVFTTWAVYLLPIIGILLGFTLFANCQWVLFTIFNFHFTFYLLMILLMVIIFSWWQSLNC